MKTVILKFGGSSVADNIKLNIVAKKVISFKEKALNVVVVVSAQGKTTDGLVKDAQELSAIPNPREMDMLLSTGEQITASKLSILLNRLGYDAISLTGWQAGIKTDNVHKNAKIEEIYVHKIKKELDCGKIVVIAGFQGYDENGDITTLGRGGSDTTAVALCAALDASKCYIFSDVDGIYTADPNITKISKRLDEISFDEMQEISDAGAKVLHNRCIKIGKQFDCNIICQSTFTNGGGTNIVKEIESSAIKGIVKNDKLVQIILKSKDKIDYYKIYESLLLKNIFVEDIKIDEQIQITIKKEDQMQVFDILENILENIKEKNITYSKKDISKLSIIGYGISQDNNIISRTLRLLKDNDIDLNKLNISQTKIEIISNSLDNEIVDILHKELINK